MKLASVNLDAEAVTAIYTCPPGQRAIVTLNLCNRASASVRTRVALTNGAAPADADWIEYDTPLPPAGSTGGSTMQLTGLALAVGQSIYARADAAGLSAVVHGVLEPI